jgi:CelD/BcsL family acetyltransferase involved in cellulose biosynthesis
MMNIEQLIVPRRNKAEPLQGSDVRASNDLNTADIVFTLTRVTEISELAVCWRDLEERADASFFQTWDWIGCWIEEAHIAPWVLVGRQAGRVVVLGVLQSSRQHRHLVVTTEALLLHHLGQIEKDVVAIEYNGFLIDRAISRDALGNCIAFLFDAQAGVVPDELHLKGVPQNYEQGARALGIRQVVMSRHPSWKVDLDRIRESGRAYLDHLGSGTRYEMHRSIRLYETRGQLCGTPARNVNEALQFFDAMKDLHQAYWSRRGRAGSFCYPFFEGFHRRLIRVGVPRGKVELFRITVGDEAIGYLYNFVHKGWVFAYQSGYRYEKDKKLKPGLVSNYLCIERHLREGGHVYDFMGGESPQKKVLGVPGVEMLDLVLQRPCVTLQAEELLRVLKRRVSRHLPQRVKNSLRIPLQRG